MRRIVVTGDREWTDRAAIVAWADRIGLGPGDVVIAGGARGADTLAADVARTCSADVIEEPAAWTVHDVEGRTAVPCHHPPSTTCPAAGPRRNQKMLDVHRPTECVWFHDDLGASRGTRDMVRRARRAGLPASSGCDVQLRLL